MNNEASNIVATALEIDANKHDAGEYQEIGSCWDNIYAEILPIEEDISSPLYNMTFRFWDDWGDAANHNWQYHKPIKKEQWPLFARELAVCLRTQTMTTNIVLLNSFMPKPKLSLLERIKKWF
jgi:hypothetical protein